MKNKKQKWIKENILNKVTSKIVKYNIVGFDIETYSTQNFYLFGGIYDENGYHFFKDRQKQHQYLLDTIKENTYIFATNLEFDFNGSYEFYDQDKFKFIKNNGTFICCQSLENKNIKFTDTGNFSSSSVENLGKLINIYKMEHPIYLAQHLTDKKEHKKGWEVMRKYNRRDCEISKKFMEQLQEVVNHLGCELKLTKASTSLDLYRRKYIPCAIFKEPIQKFKDGTKLKDFLHKSYYGGRVEAFSRGCLNNIKFVTYTKNNKKHININKAESLQKYYYYDFNSLYPSCMLNKYPFPSSAKLLEDEKGNLNLKEYLHYKGVAQIDIFVPYMKYPFLPYSTKDKLIFPTGNIVKRSYTFEEISYALSLGCTLKKCYKIVYYTKDFYPFKKFVTELYKLRNKFKKEDNKIYATITKDLMNSLYGKFASKDLKEYEFTNIKDYITIDANNNKHIDLNDLKIYNKMPNSFINYDKGIMITETKKDNDQNYVIPILSIYTTAYGRIKLHKKIVELNALYCDTDSIITTQKHKDSTELGELKLEQISIFGIIIKPKLYRLLNELNDKESVKMKGVKISKDNSIELFDKILNKEILEQQHFFKTRESIRRNKNPNSIEMQTKSISLEDNKRVWKKPFNKDELQESEPINLK